MQFDVTPLIDLRQLAETLSMPPGAAREYLLACGDHPVATYRGKELWLCDSAHDLITARIDAVLKAEAAYAETERQLREAAT